MYTSYRTSTWAGLSTTTATLAASAKPSSPVSKPSTLPGYPSATKKCTVPSATANCVPCEGQGQGPYCGFDINTDAYAETPITCNVVSYDFEITQETISPDGVDRLAFLVNGQFPGPMIRVSWGDTVMVKLTNNLPADTLNGTSLHFHGIHQNGTNEYDGSVSITQCPLAPGQSMTYTWRATSYGSSWWHAHYALQAYEGIFGPLVIDGPAAAEYDDEEFVILQDWNHATVASLLDNSEIVIPGVRGGPVTLDTGLINGMNVWEGAGQFFTMKVKAGKKYRLRIVNTAIQSTFKFHIDGHNFTVIAMDFVPIIPYSTNIISINIGQRYDLILEADQDPGNYWIRSDNQQPCGTLVKPNIQAILSYQGVDVVDPTTTSLTYVPNCLDEDATNLVPIVPFTVGARPDEEYVENTLIVPDGATPNLYKWTLNGTSFLADWNGPTLYNIWEAGTYPDYSGDLTINLPELGAWVYFVIESPIPVPHPIHLHGHDFFVLASGIGSYDDSVALHLINPPRRDVAVMPVDPANGLGGYLVIAYQTSNPGVWLLHCHIGWVSRQLLRVSWKTNAD